MHQNNSKLTETKTLSLSDIGSSIRASKTTTYFCGQFSFKGKSDCVIKQLKKWLEEDYQLNRSTKPSIIKTNVANGNLSKSDKSNIYSGTEIFLNQHEYTRQERKEMNGLFYQRFVDCMLPGKEDSDVKSERLSNKQDSINEEIDFCSLQLNRKLVMPYKNEELSFEVSKLDLYFLPHGFLIYSFCVEQADLLYDAITYINSCFRSPGRYVSFRENELKVNVGLDILEVFQPLLYIFNLNYEASSQQRINLGDYSAKNVQRYSDLTENGNKLKLFTIVEENADCPYPGYYCRENLLYDLATCSPVGASVDPDNPFHPAEEYYQQLVSENRISLFNNWQALSLFDSFVVVLNNAKSYQVECWKKDYYRFIYLHSVYVKNYLSYVNREFRKKNTSRHLMDEFLEFDKNYNFHKISYNFLPQAIYEKIRQGLEIDDELEQLHISLEREAAKQEKQRDQRLNLILSFVAFLAIFSAIKDGSDWIVALGWLKDGGLIYNISTLSVLFIFIGIPLYLYYHHKKISK